MKQPPVKQYVVEHNKLGFKLVCLRVAVGCRENVSHVNRVKSRVINVFFQTRRGVSVF